MHLTLRSVRPEDISVLREIRNDAATQAILLGHPEARSDDDTEVWVERRSHDVLGHFHVIDWDDTCVGFVQLTGQHRLDRHAHFGIALHESARGMGIGKMAMRALLALATTAGLRKLMCEVRADNASALTLYHRIGFRNVGILENHYDDGQRLWDVMVMEKLLTIDDLT